MKFDENFSNEILFEAKAKFKGGVLFLKKCSGFFELRCKEGHDFSFKSQEFR